MKRHDGLDTWTCPIDKEEPEKNFKPDSDITSLLGN
jgi:hypothetical protein